MAQTHDLFSGGVISCTNFSIYFLVMLVTSSLLTLCGQWFHWRDFIWITCYREWSATYFTSEKCKYYPNARISVHEILVELIDWWGYVILLIGKDIMRIQVPILIHFLSLFCEGGGAYSWTPSYLDQWYSNNLSSVVSNLGWAWLSRPQPQRYKSRTFITWKQVDSNPNWHRKSSEREREHSVFLFEYDYILVRYNTFAIKMSWYWLFHD